MIRKGVELLLILAVLVGGVMAWRTGSERTRVGAEYARLVRAAGDLEITDPDKVHVLALETGEPLSYAWRIYLPPAYSNSLRWKAGNASGSRPLSTGKQAKEFIARVVIREEDGRGQFRIFQHFSNGSTTTILTDGPLSDAIKRGDGPSDVERLGAPAVAVLDPDRPAVLFRIGRVKARPSKAATVPSGQEPTTLPDDLFWVEIGVPTPKKLKAATPAGGKR